MEIRHPQEKIVERYDYNGAAVELVEWEDTVWWGKIAYAAGGAEEPDVERLMEEFQALPGVQEGRERDWDVCMSIDYLSDERPSGVLFGFLAQGGAQPEGYDRYAVPKARYLRIRMCQETARALEKEPWTGGVPPYSWIGEQIGPALGYAYGDDTLPIVEYYGFFDPEKGAHEYCYLYVPVKRADS